MRRTATSRSIRARSAANSPRGSTRLSLPSFLPARSCASAVSAPAADDLTRYRVIAAAQTRESQFGAGDALVEVSKPLIVEPALPRFLRTGDEVIFRAVVRQEEDAASRVEAEMSVEGKASGRASSSLELAGRAPGVVSFRVEASEAPGNATARFSVHTPSASDAVAVSLLGGRVAVGAQDCHAKPSGAHTGDVSAVMLRDAGARWVILGHSERRADHAETDALVAVYQRFLQRGIDLGQQLTGLNLRANFNVQVPQYPTLTKCQTTLQHRSHLAAQLAAIGESSDRNGHRSFNNSRFGWCRHNRDRSWLRRWWWRPGFGCRRADQ